MVCSLDTHLINTYAGLVPKGSRIQTLICVNDCKHLSLKPNLPTNKLGMGAPIPAIPISIDVDSDSNNHAGIAVGGAGGVNSAKDSKTAPGCPAQVSIKRSWRPLFTSVYTYPRGLVRAFCHQKAI